MVAVIGLHVKCIFTSEVQHKFTTFILLTFKANITEWNTYTG